MDYQTSFLDGDLLFGDVLVPSTEFHFPGNLDEIKFYSSALNSDDVAASFASPTIAVQTNSLVGWWKGENNTLDATGQNNGKASPPFGTVVSDIATITIGAGAITLSNPAVSTGNFIATVNGTPGQTYVVQRATTLGGTWTPILTNTAPFTFTNASSAAAAFYRVQQP